MVAFTHYLYRMQNNSQGLSSLPPLSLQGTSTVGEKPGNEVENFLDLLLVSAVLFLSQGSHIQLVPFES